jgi:hypothetical protein
VQGFRRAAATPLILFSKSDIVTIGPSRDATHAAGLRTLPSVERVLGLAIVDGRPKKIVKKVEKLREAKATTLVLTFCINSTR